MKTGPEKFLEDTFCDYLSELHGALCLKLRIDGSNGFPDRSIITPECIFFIEFKSPRGRLSPRQKEWIRVLRDMRFTVFVISDFHDGAEAVEEWMREEEE